MQPSEIEIHTDIPERPYRVIGPIEVRVGSGAIFMNSRTMEDVNLKLCEEAAPMGANAVVKVEYQRGVGLTWKELSANGLAVVLEADERECPHCAEMIKRRANVCRFCGRAVEPVLPEHLVQPTDPFDESVYAALQVDHPGEFEQAFEQLRGLSQPPVYPVAWLRELCRRIGAGSPPEAAAARIPLDFQR